MSADCSCGKRSYPSQAAAQTARSHLQRRQGTSGFRIYQCDTALVWHLGRESKGLKRGKTRAKHSHGAHIRRKRRRIDEQRRRNKRRQR